MSIAKHILRRYRIAEVAIKTGSDMIIVFLESVSIPVGKGA